MKSTEACDAMVEDLWSQVATFYESLTPREVNEDFHGHAYDHIRRVVIHCRHIINLVRDQVDLDQSCLLAAAMCHDLGYGVDSVEHAKISAELAAPYLERARFAPPKTAKIQRMIILHDVRNGVPQTLEERLLFIADRCDSLGFDGTLRMFMIRGSRIGDRDVIAAKLRPMYKEEMEVMRSFGLRTELIESRWEQSKKLLDELRGFIQEKA